MMNIIDFMFDVASSFEAIANILLVVVAYQMIRNNMYKTVHLTIGTFKIRKKDFNVQNVTNIVSAKWYNGGIIPNDVRSEILKVTLPKYK